MGFLSRLFTNKPTSTPSIERRVISRDEHPVSRKLISENALKVLYRLTSQGHDAWLVGGSIRDILLGIHPKDFDIATSASPETVRGLFRNSRIIGRRFKLIHVTFGRDIIEVATFRANHEDTSAKKHKDKSRHSDSGRILRDNVYGTIEDDAVRRDFTINALYYNPEDFTVHDFCGGMEDIDNGLIRLIGDPVRRYHEDPVRMMRAVRFAAKLDFDIEESTATPIRDLGYLLKDIPSARLFDESLKMFLSGYGLAVFHKMQDYDLFAQLFPATDSALHNDPKGLLLLERALENTDARIAKDKPVTPAFFFAAALWSPMKAMRDDLIAQGMPPVPAMNQAAMQVIANQCTHTAIPKRFTIPMREIWDLQHRLERRQPKRIEELAAHPRFRAAYDFLLLREESGENLNGAGRWWTKYQEANPHLLPDNHDNRSRRRSRERFDDNHQQADNERGEKRSGNRDNRRNRRPRRRKPTRNQPD
ncbi:polynucleotide adenylyltransferase PcnB [Parendozoicomonas haliclonae]|uniref:Poly(A) polymerase I n=1 Tax=Parendozoicomonas haliclonae TaxID=1960125 RepID=A0A1X7AJ05_9GAMM|nr:polynucleotide adenylyltransferase PcnB [Parendozoicomonas haliclonae]SMA45047.1 Poly(A) polymerase I precursor [Parendozoicomonas haliclonae]